MTGFPTPFLHQTYLAYNKRRIKTNIHLVQQKQFIFIYHYLHKPVAKRWGTGEYKLPGRRVVGGAKNTILLALI